MNVLTRTLTGLAIALSLSAAPALAQGTSLDDALQLSAAALESYDFFELEDADAKLAKAIEIVESQGIDDPAVADIYIAQGIVGYGRFKDTAIVIGEQRAFSAFVKAVSIKPDVEISSDYRTDELAAFLQNAKDAVGSGSVSVGGPVAKPKLEHTAIFHAARCRDFAIEANVPEHPDIYRVYLHYAIDGVPGFREAEMTPTADSPDVLRAVIPSTEMQGNSLRYYIDAQNRAGEVLLNSATEQAPWNIALDGSCDADTVASNYGDPFFQWTILAGTSLGIVGGTALNCNGINGEDCYGEGGGKYQSDVDVSTGAAIVPFHLRTSFMFNLPMNFQVGAFLRWQIANDGRTILDNDLARGRIEEDPIFYSIMVGVDARYVFFQQPYRLYVGLQLGWGGANATVYLADYNDYSDVLPFEGPFHVAPLVGFLWSLHKNVGLAAELVIPFHFPKGLKVHFDISIGPFFQF